MKGPVFCVLLLGQPTEPHNWLAPPLLPGWRHEGEPTVAAPQVGQPACRHCTTITQGVWKAPTSLEVTINCSLVGTVGSRDRNIQRAGGADHLEAGPKPLTRIDVCSWVINLS